MKTIVALALLTLVLVACGATATPTPTPPPATPTLAIPAKRKFDHLYTIETKYDPFKDQTDVVLNPVVETIGKTPANLMVNYLYPGKAPSIPDLVSITFVSKSTDWQFLKNHDVILLLDGQERLNPTTTHDGEVGKGYVLEFVSAVVTTREFLQVANATKVQVQLFTTEFSLSDAQLEGLRDLASRMQPTEQ